MYKLYAIWTNPRPEDVEAFERHYAEVHAPLAAAIPGLRKLARRRSRMPPRRRSASASP
jgi:uncharacterized protein (TIGR02118 family)